MTGGASKEDDSMGRRIFWCSVLVFAVTVLALIIHGQRGNGEEKIIFREEMTLRMVARKNAVPLKRILHILSHEDHTVWNLPKNKPLSSLPIDSQNVLHALHHVKEESGSVYETLFYILLALLICGVSLFVLRRKKIRSIRIFLLAGVVLAFGILLGAHPNPMESIVKLFKVFNNMQDAPLIVVLSFAAFTLLSLLGSKMVCSWGCPLGALQEGLYYLGPRKKLKGIKIPFPLSLLIRLVLFLIFLCLLFGIVFGVANYVIYHNMNYFKVFSFSDIASFALYSFPILLLAAFFIFRPFCQCICPFGLYAWLLQNIALYKIHLDRGKCINCGKCMDECPTDAAKAILNPERKYMLPDCWSCGRCIEVCPTDAMKHRGR